MMTLNRLFPSAHAYHGLWQCIYLEPIVGSGERIAIAIVACGNDGQYQVIQSLRKEVIDGLYGNKAEQFQGIIDWIINSVNNHLSKNNPLETWITPFDGVYRGAIKTTSANDLTGILKQAVMQSASFGSLALEAEHDESEHEHHKKSEQRWTAQIADLVKIRNPTYANFFRKKINFHNNNTHTSYDFLGKHYAFNFGLLRATQSLNILKAKLFDLEILKNSPFTTDFTNFELIIGSPPLDDPTISEKALSKQEDSLKFLIFVADQEGISVHRVFNSQEAANHIIHKLEAA